MTQHPALPVPALHAFAISTAVVPWLAALSLLAIGRVSKAMRRAVVRGYNALPVNSLDLADKSLRFLHLLAGSDDDTWVSVRANKRNHSQQLTVLLALERVPGLTS